MPHLSAPATLSSRSRWSNWPWLVLALAVFPAVWHAFIFSNALDGEFPRVVRPTFSHRPPAAYRLAEPGDTIDRVGIYVSSIAIALSLIGVVGGGGQRRLWLASLGIGAGAFWLAANPSPTFDGWHGLGWAALTHPDTPTAQRLTLGAGLVLLAALVVGSLGLERARWGALVERARAGQVLWLFVGAGLLAVGRAIDLPGVEPRGYWPRWCLVWALILYAVALLRLVPRPQGGWTRHVAWAGLAGALWFALVSGGIWLTWYHRPLARLRELVPGKVYISAMPTARGLEVAQARHRFKTIINLFPEDGPLRSPRLPEELEFARAHGLTYVGSPSRVSESDAFLDRTLALAQDPSAWPVLVHCHGCMDRTPAWSGIYRFVVEGRPLDEILQFIEQHRGDRPKASVTLLYNRVLPRLAPERAESDPTARKLRELARGTVDPYFVDLRREQAREQANRRAAAGVSAGKAVGRVDRPSLTPRR